MTRSPIVPDHIFLPVAKNALQLTAKCARTENGEVVSRQIADVSDMIRLGQFLPILSTFPDRPTSEGDGRMIGHWQEADDIFQESGHAHFFGPKQLKYRYEIDIPEERVPPLAMTVEEVRNAVRREASITLMPDTLYRGVPNSPFNFHHYFSERGRLDRRVGNYLFDPTMRAPQKGDLQNPFSRNVQNLEWRQVDPVPLNRYSPVHSDIWEYDGINICEKIDLLVFHFLQSRGSLTATPLPKRYLTALQEYFRYRNHFRTALDRDLRNINSGASSVHLTFSDISSLKIVRLLFPTLHDILFHEADYYYARDYRIQDGQGVIFQDQQHSSTELWKVLRNTGQIKDLSVSRLLPQARDNISSDLGVHLAFSRSVVTP